MKKREMIDIVQRQLAIDLNCTVEELNGEKDSFVFVEAKNNPGRTPVPRRTQVFNMMTMGNSIIVSATPARLKYVQEQFVGKSRDEAFAMPFVAGSNICYLPDLDRIAPILALDGFEYEMLFEDRIPELYHLTGFDMAIQQDRNHPIQNNMAFVAKINGEIVAIAASFIWTAKMWSIGIDIIAEYRNKGLAAYLVNRLAFEILERDIVPCYGTASTNIASQKVGYRAGFMPGWVSHKWGRFDGELKNK